MKVAYVGIDILYPALASLFETGCEIIRIHTCRTDNVTEFNTKTVAFAREHDIPLQMDKVTMDDLYDLLANGCEFVLVGGYYYKIPIIEELPIVNIHPALLPYGRGAWPSPVTILKGLKESGITFHQMTEAMDQGDILLQKKIPVYPEDDLITLTERIHGCIPNMVKKLVSDFDRLWENAHPQEGYAEYWAMPDEKDWTIKSDMSFAEADLILRAFMGYECIYIDEKTGMKTEFIGARAHKGIPGENSVRTTWPITDGYITCERTRLL